MRWEIPGVSVYPREPLVLPGGSAAARGPPQLRLASPSDTGSAIVSPPEFGSILPVPRAPADTDHPAPEENGSRPPVKSPRRPPGASPTPTQAWSCSKNGWPRSNRRSVDNLRKGRRRLPRRSAWPARHGGQEDPCADLDFRSYPGVSVLGVPPRPGGGCEGGGPAGPESAANAGAPPRTGSPLNVDTSDVRPIRNTSQIRVPVPAQPGAPVPQSDLGERLVAPEPAWAVGAFDDYRCQALFTAPLGRLSATVPTNYVGGFSGKVTSAMHGGAAGICWLARNPRDLTIDA